MTNIAIAGKQLVEGRFVAQADSAHARKARRVWWVMHEDEHVTTAGQPKFSLQPLHPSLAQIAGMALRIDIWRGMQCIEHNEARVVEIDSELDEAVVISGRLRKHALKHRSVVVIADQQVNGRLQRRDKLLDPFI